MKTFLFYNGQSFSLQGSPEKDRETLATITSQLSAGKVIFVTVNRENPSGSPVQLMLSPHVPLVISGPADS